MICDLPMIMALIIVIGMVRGEKMGYCVSEYCFPPSRGHAIHLNRHRRFTCMHSCACSLVDGCMVVALLRRLIVKPTLCVPARLVFLL